MVFAVRNSHGLRRRCLLRQSAGYAAAASFGGAISARAAALMPAQAGRLEFDVFRNGSRIGTHALVFDRQGDSLEVRIDCRMAIGFGPLVLFRYRHQGIERWQSGAFAGIETETDSNGTALHVRAVREPAGIRVEATGQPIRMLPAGTLPLTHWNIHCMSAPLFNPQDGNQVDGAITARAPGEVTLASGQRLAATRFSLTGKQMLDDWYDSAGIWAGLQARATDGSKLEYRRL